VRGVLRVVAVGLDKRLALLSHVALERAVLHLVELLRGVADERLVDVPTNEQVAVIEDQPSRVLDLDVHIRLKPEDRQHVGITTREETERLAGLVDDDVPLALLDLACPSAAVFA
jgi:hypothetical protein